MEPQDTETEPGGMSVREAGRRGGEQVKARYGVEHYRTIGQKGGQGIVATHGPEHFRALGQKGGRIAKERHGREHYTTIGRKGGELVKAKYGPDFYAQIGQQGGRAARHVAKTCLHCGTQFEAHHAALYCSLSCRRTAQVEQKRAAARRWPSRAGRGVPARAPTPDPG